MKIDKKNLRVQRDLIEEKLQPWLKLRGEKPPPSGWIKALRGALGMSTYQLADHMNINQATAVRLEQREAQGKATIELIEKAANAMDCKLVYAIVPKDEFANLDEIITRRAELLARELLGKVEHSMRLEDQGTGKRSKEQKNLVEELKEEIDSRIWNKRTKK